MPNHKEREAATVARLDAIRGRARSARAVPRPSANDVPTLVYAIERVRNIHHPVRSGDSTVCGECNSGYPYGDSVPYPCPTIEAIHEVMNGDQ